MNNNAKTVSLMGTILLCLAFVFIVGLFIGGTLVRHQMTEEYNESVDTRLELINAYADALDACKDDYEAYMLNVRLEQDDTTGVESFMRYCEACEKIDSIWAANH